MQITVFGAGGKVGSLVVEEALRRGHTVVAFVHNHSMFSPSGNLIVKKGDIYNTGDVEGALRASDAVVSCLGSWGTPKRNVLTAAMQAVVPAMVEHKIKRIVTLTGSGAKAPGEAIGAGYKLMMKLLAPFPAGKVFADGQEHMAVLAASNLDWTTIRSPVMTNAGSANYRLDLKTGGATIGRKAVVAAILDQLEVTDFVHKAPIIHRA